MATPPHLMDAAPASVDAERTVLGAIFLDNSAFFDDAAVIEADDFSLDSNRRIYQVMTEILFGLVEGVKQVDIVTLSEVLRTHKWPNGRSWLEDVGGVAYLASLTEGLPRQPVISEYIKIIREKAMLRRIMAACNGAIARAYEQTESPLAVINSLETQLAEVIDRGVIQSAVSIGSVAPTVEAKLLKARQISSEKTTLEMSWGVDEWDQETKGCYRGEFTVLSAESSGGKTSWVVQQAIRNATEGTPVLIFSLEMTKEALTQRFYAALSDKLTTDHVRDPRLMNLDTHVPAMREVTMQLAKLPIEIDDTSPLRIDTMKKRIRMWRRKWKSTRPDIDKLLVQIDYLQLIKGMPRMAGQEKAENIVFTIRDLPKVEPDVHIVALSQYSQGDKFRKSKKRTKDSLFWGSVVHHAAQNVIMLRIEDPGDKDASTLLETEIYIEKQREGRRGFGIKTYYDRKHLRFVTPQPVLRG